MEEKHVLLEEPMRRRELYIERSKAELQNELKVENGIYINVE